MNRDREQRYLEAQRLILALLGLAVVWVIISGIIAVYSDKSYGSREISIAAQVCWDQGQRAVMHNDGSIECRD
jgi:type II secretory pathway component PulK